MKKANKNISPMNLKKAQVTIFIIIALIIVVSIAFILVIWKKPKISISEEENPDSYIRKCTKDAVKETLEILMRQGGYVSPTNFKIYNNEKISYLCYTENYYERCKNQEPMLIEHLEKEITENIQPQILTCFNSLKTELEKRGYVVSMKDINVSTELQPGKIHVKIEREFTMAKNEESKTFKEFESYTISPIYNLALIALEISNEEAENCDFDYMAYNMIHNSYIIKKERAGDGYTKIYSIKEKSSEKQFQFAVRSCVITPVGT